MGPSTARKLDELGVTNYFLPWSPNEVALVDAVSAALAWPELV